MRVVVTGGAGFIGSHLSARLLDEGHDVVCLDNFLTGRRANVERLSGSPRFTAFDRDVSSPVFVDGEVDAVLHFASPASPVDYLRYPIQTLKVGAVGTWHTLGLARAKRARYLLASTSEVYGDPKVNPQPETYWGHVNPIGPRGVYDEAKRYAEAMTMAYHRSHGMDTRIVRIFNTYGPGMRADDGRAIPEFVTCALDGKPLVVHGDGTQTRSVCYVDDLVDGIVRLMMLDGPVSDPVNLGNPTEMTVLRLAEIIRELCGSDSEIAFGPRPEDDPNVRCPDIARARALLGWEPAVAPDVGLARTVEWFRTAR
ncbi:MAG TPA: UDP-glucuronic acid decarboxylase family protein [Actinomycetota bacterium]